jgi:hypothetical protein
MYEMINQVLFAPQKLFFSNRKTVLYQQSQLRFCASVAPKMDISTSSVINKIDKTMPTEEVSKQINF